MSFGKFFKNLFGKTSDDVLVQEGPERELFVADELIEEDAPVPAKNVVLDPYDKAVAFSEMDYSEIAKNEVFESKGVLELDSRLAELVQGFQNVMQEAVNALEDKRMRAEHSEAFFNAHNQYTEALKHLRIKSMIEKKLDLLEQAKAEAPEHKGMVVGILQSYKRGYMTAMSTVKMEAFL